MKKWLIAVLAAAMMVSMCACGGTDASAELASAAETAQETNSSSAAESKDESTAAQSNEETAAEEEHTHSFGEWEVVTEATCTEDGEENRVCTECGESESQVIPATGHSFAPATCFLPKTCSVCGVTEGDPLATTITAGETVSAEDHSFYIADTYYATKLSEKSGNITRSYGNEGNYLIIKLSFTNLATEALDDFSSSRVTDLTLTYGNKYTYEGDFVILSDDIVPLATGNAYLLFAVPDSMESDAAKSIYATFTVDGTQYAYVVSWGDGSDWETATTDTAESSTDDAATEATSDLSVGDTRTGDLFEFTLSDAFFTTKLSEKNGSTTYSYGSDGNYLVFKLAFTNLATEAIDEFDPSIVSDMRLTYNEKYNYEGDARILVGDIVPLATGNLYIVFEVPDTIEGAAEPLTATFTVDGNVFNVDCRANGL